MINNIMVSFHEWYDLKSVDQAIDQAFHQNPKTSDGIDSAYDHYYTIEIPADDNNWKNMKNVLDDRVKSRIGDSQFYPSHYGLQYMGVKGKDMVFYLLGFLRREQNDKMGWLPPKGVYAPRKVVDLRMTFGN